MCDSELMMGTLCTTILCAGTKNRGASKIKYSDERSD